MGKNQTFYQQTKFGKFAESDLPSPQDILSKFGQTEERREPVTAKPMRRPNLDYNLQPKSRVAETRSAHASAQPNLPPKKPITIESPVEPQVVGQPNPEIVRSRVVRPNGPYVGATSVDDYLPGLPESEFKKNFKQQSAELNALTVKRMQTQLTTLIEKVSQSDVETQRRYSFADRQSKILEEKLSKAYDSIVHLERRKSQLEGELQQQAEYQKLAEGKMRLEEAKIKEEAARLAKEVAEKAIEAKALEAKAQEAKELEERAAAEKAERVKSEQVETKTQAPSVDTVDHQETNRLKREIAQLNTMKDRTQAIVSELRMRSRNSQASASLPATATSFSLEGCQVLPAKPAWQYMFSLGGSFRDWATRITFELSTLSDTPLKSQVYASIPNPNQRVRYNQFVDFLVIMINVTAQKYGPRGDFLVTPLQRLCPPLMMIAVQGQVNRLIKVQEFIQKQAMLKGSF